MLQIGSRHGTSHHQGNCAHIHWFNASPTQSYIYQPLPHVRVDYFDHTENQLCSVEGFAPENNTKSMLKLKHHSTDMCVYDKNCFIDSRNDTKELIQRNDELRNGE